MEQCFCLWPIRKKVLRTPRARAKIAPGIAEEKSCQHSDRILGLLGVFVERVQRALGRIGRLCKSVNKNTKSMYIR